MWGALILAGGSGARMGAGRNKVLLPLGGKAVLSRSVEAFLPHAEAIIVVARSEDEKDIRAALSADGLPVERLIFAPGGETRQDSVRNGLAALPAGCDCVMIHDGARCLVDEDTILRVKASVEACGTGVAAIQAIDTIKQADERNVAVGNRAKSAAFDAMLYIYAALNLALAMMQADLAVVLLLVFAYLLVVGLSIYYRCKFEKIM